jgi:hypothetical protein
MAKYAQGFFTPKNPEKYIGKNKPKFRSSWEMVFMTFLDQNINISQWASESIVIPYRHPLTGKISNYIPDFVVVYKNKNGKQLAEVVEIKPRAQTVLTEARSKSDQMAVIVNTAKWNAAQIFCKRAGMKFRVITEHDIFINGRR